MTTTGIAVLVLPALFFFLFGYLCGRNTERVESTECSKWERFYDDDEASQ